LICGALGGSRKARRPMRDDVAIFDDVDIVLLKKKRRSNL
jgi:hypothetical protein